jgi:hypothetical protein
MLTQSVEFVQACEIVTGRKADEPVDPERARRLAIEAEAERQRKSEKWAQDAENERRKAYAIWREARKRPWVPGEAVAEYLRLRAVSADAIQANAPFALHSSIRQSDSLPWWDGQGEKPVVIHAGPAMVAAIQRPDGTFGGVHLTWIDLGRKKGRLVLPNAADGQVRPTKKVRGTQKGGAIRLYTPPVPTRIVMGEGIESTLSVLCHAFEPDTAYWAGINLWNMAGRALRDGTGAEIHDQPDMEDEESFVPPEWCEELVFLADGDSEESRITEKLTRGLRRAIRLRPGLKAKRVPAPATGADMNDLAMQMRDAVVMGAGA